MEIGTPKEICWAIGPLPNIDGKRELDLYAAHSWPATVSVYMLLLLLPIAVGLRNYKLFTQSKNRETTCISHHPSKLVLLQI